MKKLFFTMSILICTLLSACSKKNDTVIAIHTIQVKASGTAVFSVKVSTIKSGLNAAVVADSKTAVSAPYDFTATLNQGDRVILDLSTETGNEVTFSFSDNGTQKLQGIKEIGSFSSSSVEYVVE